ncbi:MAG: VCBS repeat-containing protein [Chitinophagaceae bacterium]
MTGNNTNNTLTALIRCYRNVKIKWKTFSRHGAPGSLPLLFGICLVMISGCREAVLFERISSSHSGIHFDNKISENDSINPIDLEFLYNGGGVAVGDFNNDHLPDLYFTASIEPNRLYLNKGDLMFEDITGEAQVGGNGRWANGASVVDINNDGWEDIYVCNTIRENPQERKNHLYINQGLNSVGIPVFKDMAEEYHLADTSYSVHASFFDYDNDSDLDMYLLTTRLAKRSGVQFMDNYRGDTLKSDVDKLFRNDWSDSLNHPVFTDVSATAGIREHGYGLGLAVVDINKDGWKDIYVTNDFLSSDLLYINNKDGTFSEKARTVFKHTSQNAMGNDVADINNDGLADVFAVDMNPADNLRKKKNMNGGNYYVYQSMINGDYMLQYVRNTLQLNRGPAIFANDSIGEPVFSEVSFFSGVAASDWSWNPSLADFNNDGLRDIIITNGYPRDVTDHDFASFRATSKNIVSKQELIQQMPRIKIANYGFVNKGNLQFEDVSAIWGLQTPSFSNGAVYADLDNDGDLDYVVNNINDEAFVYRNTLNTPAKVSANYLQLRFKGDEKNINGLGAYAEIHYKEGQLQVYENNPCRGYLSWVGNIAHFGLGQVATIDSLIVIWPGGKKQLINDVKANQRLEVIMESASLDHNFFESGKEVNRTFTDITDAAGIRYRHQEMDFIDFDVQRLLPHKLSQYGPALASGDVDGNGLDDLVIGGTGDYPAAIILQQAKGTFIERKLPLLTGPNERRPENMGVLLFDADDDRDLDLYIANGSSEFAANSKNYQDRFYQNDGKGKFQFLDDALPVNYTSKSCVKAADFDKDGDLDLFLGGRVIPGKYPLPVSSYIFRNDSRQGNIKFTDITHDVAPDLVNIGLVCDGLWTDYDNDGWDDLMLAGEWMPITLLKNNRGKLQDITASTGIDKQSGWWNSITAGDFDSDGDIDYIAGNLGQNSFYRASDQYPVSIYAKDFDQNGSIDAVPVVYLPAENGTLKEYPAHTRDEMVEQLPSLKKRFLTYKVFGQASIPELFNEDELKDALILKANYYKSSYIENLANGKFNISPLPVEAQLAPIYGMVVDDFNGDGHIDVILCGNDFGMETSNGRHDALNGLLLSGNGKGNFKAHTIWESGIFISGDARAMVKLIGSNDTYLLATSQNRDRLKVLKATYSQKLIHLETNDKYIFITYRNGRTRKEEVYYGNSFLSQSSRFVCMDSLMTKIEIVNSKGQKRVIESK